MFWKKKSPLFADFIAMAQKLVTSSQLLDQLFRAEATQRSAFADQLKQNEHQADKIAHAIFYRLHHTFIHPFEQDDIISFTKALDDVVDSLYHIGESCGYIFCVESIRPEALEFAKLLQDACLYVQRITHLLSDIEKHTKTLEEYWIAIHQLENQADALLRAAMCKLFLELERQEISISLYCAWQELFRMLENATDQVEECAQITEQLTMKYS